MDLDCRALFEQAQSNLELVEGAAAGRASLRGRVPLHRVRAATERARADGAAASSLVMTAQRQHHARTVAKTRDDLIHTDAAGRRQPKRGRGAYWKQWLARVHNTSTQHVCGHGITQRVVCGFYLHTFVATALRNVVGLRPRLHATCCLRLLPTHVCDRLAPQLRLYLQRG